LQVFVGSDGDDGRDCDRDRDRDWDRDWMGLDWIGL